MKSQKTFYRIRELIGWLGLLLPFILIGGNSFLNWFNKQDSSCVLPSISHYHYSYMGVVFTGVLMTYGFLLISYFGYENSIVKQAKKQTFKQKTAHFFSDNRSTNIAGFCAILVAIIPTGYASGLMHTPNGHSIEIIRFIHLGGAGLFLTLLGVMSFFKFPIGEHKRVKDKSTPINLKEKAIKRIRIYKVCGAGIWVSIVLLILIIAFEFPTEKYKPIFWVETVALGFFGISWLLKAKSIVFVWVGLVSGTDFKTKYSKL